MKDFLGQELFVGDNVVESTGHSTGNLNQRVITGFTKQYVILKSRSNPLKDYYGLGKDHIFPDDKKSSSKIIKIDTILNNLDKPKEL